MARLLSVNVGLPKYLAADGRTIRTAILKRPVEGRVMARTLNLDGDRQADLVGHGGEQRAVLVYQVESYRFWETLLAHSKMAPGQFGENFTVSGLSDEDVFIGDRFRIGSAVFEVSQPRVTCNKLAVRMSRPDMPSLLVRHRRPGFYMRVITEGDVGVGDDIEKIESGRGMMSVAAINMLLYGSAHPIGDLEKALANPALSPGWRGSFRALVDAAGSDSATNVGLVATAPARPAWSGFRPSVVVAIADETKEVRSIEFSTEGDPLPRPLPGQHLVLRLSPDGARPIIRPYSLSGDPQGGTYRISVKREPGGVASTFLHENVRLGDRIEISSPRGSFLFKPPASSPIVLLSAGIGVTPLLSMLHAAAECVGSDAPVWWIHAARDSEHHALASEAKRLTDRSNTMTRCIVYSRPLPSNRIGADYDQTGHIDIALLTKLDLPKTADFYLCGPTGFLHTVRTALLDFGVALSRLHVESFGLQRHGAIQAPTVHESKFQGSEAAITFIKSNVTVPWEAGYGSLLELAEAHGIPIPWSCRAGVCHRCETPVIDGTVCYVLDPIDPPGDAAALLCCARPVGDVQLDA